jgi:predicted peptidase
MKTLHQLFACFLLFALIFSCSKSEDNNEPPARTYADVQNDFNNFTFSAGINDVSLIGVDYAFWEFRVVMPDIDFTNNNRPLIITLHGFSGGDTNAHKNTDCYAEPGFSALDAIIISPNNRGFQWFEPYNQAQVLTLVDLAKNYLPVDTNKIVVNGYSDGGNGAWWFSENHSNIFSAGIPMASAYGSYHSSGIARIIPTPTYVIHGEDDELFPLANTQDWVSDTSASGSDTTLVVATGLTHTEPCNYISYLQDAATWLTDVVW